MRLRVLVIVLVVQIAVAVAFAVLAARGLPATARPSRAPAPAFDATRAYVWLRHQVALGPRPAGSAASRSLAGRLRAALPHGRFEPVPGGLRNVLGSLPGRRPAVLVGAHYDTKDIPGFVGADDGASGTAVVMELAHELARERPRPGARELRFVLFDGEEAPAGVADSDFLDYGDRGSRAYAERHGDEVGQMILLDFVGNRHLRLAREAGSDPVLWARLRAAARRAGVGRAFPDATAGQVYDDHTPFTRLGVPAVDLIDFDYPCFHRTCDDLAHVSRRSLGQAGAAVAELLRELR